MIGAMATLPFGVESAFSYQFPSTLQVLTAVAGLVVFVIVFGTILAYGLYLAGLRRLSATEIGLASSSEPIVASGAAYLLLGVILTGVQYLGGAMIILAVILLASRKVGEVP
jgi:drug/metabolite transporter (DMT)-like permease